MEVVHMSKKLVSVFLDKEDIEKLKQLAQHLDVSMSWLIRQAVKRYIQELEKTVKPLISE